jgi:hypothetical protein
MLGWLFGSGNQDDKDQQAKSAAKLGYIDHSWPDDDEEEEAEMEAAGWRLVNVLGKGHQWVPPKGRGR